MNGDAELSSRLQAGDEQAFVTLVDRYHSSLLRLASAFVPSPAVAEEVVEDTWLAVVRGVERFEGRSSLETWLFRILVNRARTTGVRERRSATSGPAAGSTVDPQRFGRGGHWIEPPTPWPDDAEDRLVAGALAERIRSCLAELPDTQRQVVLMRDVNGLPSRDVCEVLGISEGNQRVLLHRGRARLRGMLEHELGKA